MGSGGGRLWGAVVAWVRADGVVVDTPLFDDDPGLADGVEDLVVEQFVPEPRVEALDGCGPVTEVLTLMLSNIPNRRDLFYDRLIG